jgi:hypothetical protein
MLKAQLNKTGRNDAGQSLAACECEDTGEPEALGIADRAQTPAGKNYRHRE